MPAFSLGLAHYPHSHPYPQTSSDTDICVQMVHWGRLSGIGLGRRERGRVGQREKLPYNAGGASALSWGAVELEGPQSVLKQRRGLSLCCFSLRV